MNKPIIGVSLLQKGQTVLQTITGDSFIGSGIDIYICSRYSHKSFIMQKKDQKIIAIEI